MYIKNFICICKKVTLTVLSIFFLSAVSPVLFAYAAELPTDTNNTVSSCDLYMDNASSNINTEVDAVYYILRENLVQPTGDSSLEWNGYWRVGYGTLQTASEVLNNPQNVSALLGDIPSNPNRIGQDQQVEWYTVRKTENEWRVEGRIISNTETSLVKGNSIDNAMFYLLNRNVVRPDSDRAVSRSTYFTQIGYGTISTPSDTVNTSEEINNQIIYIPDCSSYLEENEYIEWYAIRNNNGIWEVEGEICNSESVTLQTDTATFYLLTPDTAKPDDETILPWTSYRRIGYGTIQHTDTSINDSADIANMLSIVPDCSQYLEEGDFIEWYVVRECDDSTNWRIDGVIHSASDTNTSSNFIRTNGTQIVDSTGAPFQIKGIGMGNNVWYSQWQLPTTDHDEESYAELEALGFNSVRFYLNASLFESDSNPYVYDENAFQWLDENVKWAKEHNIRLLLNMHIPQGGKIDSYNTKLWDNEEYQNRFIALWTEIAERYADEDAVLGYGLLNEPFVTECSTADESLDLYYNLMEKTAQAIRSVDNNHMLFVERPYGVVNSTTHTTNYVWGTTDSFRLISDKNTVYEFHFYDMTEYTHQGLDWLTYTDKWIYNTDNVALLSGKRTLGKICKAPASVDVTSTEWQHVETDLFEITNPDANYGYWIHYLYNIGDSGKVYMDNFTIKEYDANGTYLRDLHFFDFDEVTSCSGWDVNTNGGGTYLYNATAGVNNTGCAQISNVNATYRFYRQYDSVSTNFPIDSTHKYSISADIKLENVSPDFSMELGIQTGNCENVYAFDKEFLQSRLQPFLQFGETNNVALYLGEFGVTRHIMNEEYHGDDWVNDMFDLINEYGLSYSYHDYHEQNFGLYINDSREQRNEKNEILYSIFEEKVD